jgi:putative Ca2+/H+ antiporter (TMEM165/GDT1 family)
MTDALTAIPFSFLLAIATGPVFFVLLETSISKGSRAAFMVDVGAVFADVVFIAIAFLGTKSLLVDIKDNPNLYVLGGVLFGYLVIGVVKIILAKQLSDKLTPRIIYKLRMSVCVLLTAFGLYFIYQGVFAVDAETLIETIEDWG